MAEIIYALCALASAVCALLLLRSFLRQRTSLLLWSATCFGGLTLSSALLFVDLVVVPTVDLSAPRAAVAAASMALLVFGLIWSTRSS